MTVAFTTASCLSPNCSHNANANIYIGIANSLAEVSAPSTYYYGALGYYSVGINESDSNADGVIEVSSKYGGQPPEIKKVYLKAGQILHVRLDAYYSQTNIQSTYTISTPANLIDLTIIKL